MPPPPPPPTEGQKQVPSPVTEKWVPITNIYYGLYHGILFFGQRSCTIFTVQILLLSIQCFKKLNIDENARKKSSKKYQNTFFSVNNFLPPPHSPPSTVLKSQSIWRSWKENFIRYPSFYQTTRTDFVQRPVTLNRYLREKRSSKKMRDSSQRRNYKYKEGQMNVSMDEWINFFKKTGSHPKEKFCLEATNPNPNRNMIREQQIPPLRKVKV